MTTPTTPRSTAARGWVGLRERGGDASPAAPSTSTPALRGMHAAMHALFLVLLTVGAVRGVATHPGLHAAAVVAAAVVILTLYLAGLPLARRVNAAASALPEARRIAPGVTGHDAAHAIPPRDVTAEDDAGARLLRPALGQAWISLLVIAWIGSLCVTADFAWLAFALYFLVLHVARRALAAALIAVVLVAGIVALGARAHTRGAGAVIGPVVGMLVALGIAWVYAQLRRESEARARLVAQLVAAQADVLASGEALALAQHDAGVLAERERLARDIHDTLAQQFSSTLLLTRAALARDDGAPHTALLRQIEATAADGLTQAREVVHALAPAELAEAPLVAALERLCERLASETGLDARACSEGAPRALPAVLDVALLRIAQGALANVRQHAEATRVGVTLTYGQADVTLEIIDDGRGFTEADVERAPLSGSGFGLRASRERIEALGGEFTVESSPGDGAALVVTLPTAGPLAREDA